ncbi:AEC family transporter [Blautia sp. CLA-JM-H16]|mgnify:FL=1|uniref:AEC family transporter n=1 Tax=Blautia aquisgranensis TaxID=3133153 RepID=A0ABV1BF29_9FIRM
MITLQLLQQIVVFFLMMACGFLVVKRGLIDAKSSRMLSVICIYIIMPCVMINAFQIEYSKSIRDGFLLAVAAAVLIHIFLLVFVRIIGKPLKLSVLEKASIIYSNSGNLVIPMVTVVLGEKWVIYASAFLSVQMILMWTHGESLMEAKAGVNWKKILCNINLIAIIIGIILFFARIRLPVVIGNTMSQISATLGPVCMIMLGMTMTEVNWKEIFSHSRIYLITALKMIVTPLFVLLLLKYSPLASMVKDGQTILLISLMAVITPSATTVVQLAQLYDEEPVYASTINVMTTIVSIVTMPLMVMLYLA